MANEREQKAAALTALGIARRERLKAEDFGVYVPGLQAIPAAIVTDVCRELAIEEPGEFEPRFPMLATILARCRAKVRTAAASRQLPAPAIVDPISPAKHDEIRRQFRALVQAKRMPRLGRRPA